MKKIQKGGFFPPQKPPKHKVTENVKIEVELNATQLVDLFLKPKYIKSTHNDEKFMYIVDIYTNWY